MRQAADPTPEEESPADRTTRLLQEMNLKHVAWMEERIREQLDIGGYGHLGHLSVFNLCHPTEFQADTRTLGTFGDFESNWFSLPTSDPVPTDRRTLPAEIRDLAHALAILDIVREYVSLGHPNSAIGHMFLATAVAMRGGAELLKKDERTVKARQMGSASAQNPKKLRIGRVEDAYLRDSSPKSNDGKTSVAQRAHMKLRSHHNLAERVLKRDQAAEQRLRKDSPAPDDLLELVRNGWTPPRDYRALYKRQPKKKQ